MRAASSGSRGKSAAANTELLAGWPLRTAARLDIRRRIRDFEMSNAGPIVATTALAFLVVLQLVSNAALASLHVPFDHSEGWNAYNAAAAMAGRDLYPSKSSFWFNNYPPLSFYVVGEVGRWTGDYLVAGRYVALGSTLAAACSIAGAARAMKCDTFESLFAALLFLASPWVSSKFSGVDDPQMLGHALGCAGFAITVSRPRSAIALVVSAFLLALAEFVKPLFVVQPLTLLIWLGSIEPANAMIFAAAGLHFAGLGVIATDAALGVPLMDRLLSARAYSVTRMFSHPGQWLITGFLPLLATLSLFRPRRDRFALLCALYAALALAFSLFFCGGEGVGGNPTIDLSVATSLGLAVFAARRRTRTSPGPARSLHRLFIAVSCIVFGGALLASATVGWDSGPTALTRLRERSVAARDVVFVRLRHGPALCETSAVCYWAGKSAEVDVWGWSQALKTHTRDDAALIQLLDARRFATVQLERHSSTTLFADVRAILRHRYRIDHIDAIGTFLVPRATADEQMHVIKPAQSLHTPAPGPSSHESAAGGAIERGEQP